MARSNKKGVQFTLNKNLAERISFLRKFKHRIDNLDNLFEEEFSRFASKIEKNLSLREDSWRSGRACPSCATGVVFEKRSAKKPNSTPFLGCSRYPACKHTEKVNKG